MNKDDIIKVLVLLLKLEKKVKSDWYYCNKDDIIKVMKEGEE